TPMPYDGAVMRLKIPRFEVDSLIENIGILPNGYLDTPHDPYNTGWYDIYDKPGFGGNAVFAAHVDYYPRIRGPFYDLDEMNAGDQVVIQMEDGREYIYEVISKVRYPEAEIPMGLIIDAPERPPDQEWITLITCGGRFRPNNGVSGPGHYLDRDVVVAMRVQ
ncbi:MAG: class F sortase, partial [Dehalococcoidia bacterium]